jgi:uridine kinase
MLTTATSLELESPIGDNRRTAMCGEVVASADNVTQLIPGTSTRLSRVPDGELLNRTRQLVGKSNLLFAALLEHLAEVEARGLHRARRCASLYTYCIYELRFSEDAAARRSGAAKLVRRFPVLLDAIAKGELHLTGLLMLGPHLTEANHVEVLGRAKFRTKKEIGKLVRSLSPLPDVPDLVEPLRPALPRSLRKPTWEEWVASFCPPVRELQPGERPSDWVNEAVSDSADDVEAAMVELAAGRHSLAAIPPVAPSSSQADERSAGANEIDVDDSTGLTTAPARVLETARDLPPITGPQLYQVQFTTTEEHVDLIERAKALLSNKPSLGELHLQAMRLLVEALEKKRYGAKRSRQRGVEPGAEHPRRRGSKPLEVHGRRRGSESVEEHPRQRGVEPGAEHPRERGNERVEEQRQFLESVECALCTHGGTSAPLFVAIDGPGCSGKTTLTEELCIVLGGDVSVLSLDSLLLPLRDQDLTYSAVEDLSAGIPHLRWEELEAILERLAGGQDASYRCFDWKSDSLGDSVLLRCTPIVIIEGLYALHPRLRDFYRLKVWLDGLVRGVSSGPSNACARVACLLAHAIRWIRLWRDLYVPREQAYLVTHRPFDAADLFMWGFGLESTRRSFAAGARKAPVTR